MPDLNQFFRACQAGAVAEYSQIEETFNADALKMISDWIREVTAR